MKRLYGTLRYGACALALSLFLTACNNSKPVESAIPEDIQGIATPSNISVVTATNAD